MSELDDPHAVCDACERDDALDPHANRPGLDAIAYRIGDYDRFRRRMEGWLGRQRIPPQVGAPDAEARAPLTLIGTAPATLPHRHVTSVVVVPDALGDPPPYAEHADYVVDYDAGTVARVATGAIPSGASVIARYFRRPLASFATRSPDDPAIALVDAWACALDVLTFYQERIANEGFLRTATERRSVLELARAIGYALRPGVAASTRLVFTLLDTPKAPREVPLPAGLQVQSVPGPGERPQTFETDEAIVARPEHNVLLPARREPHQPADSDVIWLDSVATGLRVGDRIAVLSGPALPVLRDLRTIVALDVRREEGVTEARLDRRLDPRHHAPAVVAFGRRANVFGHSAPDPRMFGATQRSELATLLTGNEWNDFGMTEAGTTNVVHLVGEHPEIVPGAWLAFEDADDERVYAVSAAEVSGRTDFLLSLKTTRVTLAEPVDLTGFSPRTVTVHAISRTLELGTRAILDPVAGDEILLDTVIPPLDPGRAIVVEGVVAGTDAAAVEVAIVDECSDVGPRTVLKLERPLERAYDRQRTQLRANVVRASHGATVAREVLGSGDGSIAFQSFTLRQGPLTHVARPGEGLQSTLTVRVGGVEWDAVASTFGRGLSERVYVPRIGDDGSTTLTFGDGAHGARLPTGRENVSARYRVGIGSEGAVKSGALTVLKTRPQGVKAVTNPLAAFGAQDPETLADARANAPVTVLTLDRLVSVRDYEHYARAYPGIGKAQSIRLWDGRRTWVHLTLATSEGTPLLPGDDLHASLLADIHARRDPVQRVIFDTFELRHFGLSGTVRVDPRFVAEEVIAEIESVLRAAFAFERRGFGQVVTGAEIVALVHGIDGVVAVDLDSLYFTAPGAPLPSGTSPATWVLPAYPARFGAGVVQRAELLLLDPAGEALALTEAIG